MPRRNRPARRRRQANAHTRREYASPPEHSELANKCACGKVWASGRQHAERLASAVQHGHNHNPIRFYQCHMGTWHWTSQMEMP